MKLISRWHLTNLGHSDDKEEIIISSLVLFLVFPLKTIYRGNDSDGPGWIAGSERWLYTAVRSRQPTFERFICLWLFCVWFVMRGPNISHMAHTVPSFSKVSQISLWTCLLSHREQQKKKKVHCAFYTYVWLECSMPDSESCYVWVCSLPRFSARPHVYSSCNRPCAV